MRCGALAAASDKMVELVSLRKPSTLRRGTTRSGRDMLHKSTA